jgi:ArsR family transcriptional regulator, lead/cadmium/zinc/bismuth-responsive transcriptional repressor
MTKARPPLSDGSAVALAETFKVLGDTTRIRILDALSRSELCVHDIARRIGLSESAVSHQLRLLRGTRLVRTRRNGRRIFYTLDDQHIVGLFVQGLEHVEERIRVASDSRVPSPPASSTAGYGEARRRATRTGGRPARRPALATR